MYRACIAIVDASRARLFTFERISDGDGLRENMIEQRDLVSLERRDGDPHRDSHTEEVERRFATRIVDEIAEVIRSPQTNRLVICASPHMLGKLRDARGATFNKLELEEVARDLVTLSPAALREHLTAYGVLPAAAP
jgi:protein required for attachment to host cells